MSKPVVAAWNTTSFPDLLPSVLGAVSILSLATVMSSCGGGSSSTISPVPPPPPPPPTVTVSIFPKTISLPLGGFNAFSATATGSSNTNINWSVTEGASAGSVDHSGLFTASHAAGTYHVVATSAANPADSDIATVVVSGSSVDDLIATCPTKDEITAFNSALTITFEGDPTAPTLVCTAAAGSADLTRLQERAFQALRVMKALQYDAPLPWTDKPLYDWFTSIQGIRFRSDIQTSFCCDPVGVINLQTGNMTALSTTRWIDPALNGGLADLVNLLVHEARHVYSGPHTCGNNDQTISELNGWGVQYYSEEWMAFHSGTFLMPTASAPSSSYYHDTEWKDAQVVRDSRFCSNPALLPSPKSLTFQPQELNTSSPAQVVAVTSGTATTVNISDVHISGDTTDFNLESTTCSNVPVSPSCVAIVRFKPTTAGGKSATLAIDGPTGQLLAIPLSGFCGVVVSISPVTTTINESDLQSFSGSVLGSSNGAIAWSVMEGPAGGTISTAGVYTAPTIQTGGTFHVTATSVADPSQSATATITVQPVTLEIDPQDPIVVVMTASLPFSAIVQANAAHQTVNWSVSEGIAGGSITSAGVYTAPSSPGTYHVVATSTVFPSVTGTVPVTVPPVSVTIFPTTDTLGEHVTRQFSATVTSVHGVTWTTDDPSGSVDTNGLYTAGTIPGGYHVRATSNEDPTKFDEATVNVTPHGFRYTAGTLAGTHSFGTTTLLDCTAQGISGCGDLDGHVVIMGDWYANKIVEAYDPATDSFAQVGVLPNGRSNHGAALLDNGKLLIAGGDLQAPGEPSTPTATALLFDPATRSFTPTGTMTTAREGPSLTVLKDGTVLVVGGWNGALVNSVEVYDPSTGAFHTANGQMNALRSGGTATRLQDGRVLFVGGGDNNTIALSTAEIYDPATGTFTLTAGTMSVARAFHSATPLPNGKILVVGGYDADVNQLDTMEIYDPATDKFTVVGKLPSPVFAHTATLLGDGTVLVAGGGEVDNPIADAVLVAPATGTTTVTGSLRVPLGYPTGILLPDGMSVFVMDGTNFAGLKTTEIYK